MLRHVEHRSELKRGILVLKMRGSSHDHSIHELVIGEGDLVVGEPFTEVTGILSGLSLGSG